MFVVCVPLGRSESGWCGSKSKNTRELNHAAKVWQKIMRSNFLERIR